PAPTPTAISTLSLHDALPILAPDPELRRLGPDPGRRPRVPRQGACGGEGRDPCHRALRARAADQAHPSLPRPVRVAGGADARRLDRKSTRLNSSHVSISYAVF